MVSCGDGTEAEAATKRKHLRQLEDVLSLWLYRSPAANNFSMNEL